MKEIFRNSLNDFMENHLDMGYDREDYTLVEWKYAWLCDSVFNIDTYDTNLSVNYTGNLYPCVRYMESSLNYRQKPIIVGNVNEGYLSTEEHKINHQQVSNITRRSQSTDKCFYCPIAAGCSWCSAYNYEEFGTANKRATYICCMH